MTRRIKSVEQRRPPSSFPFPPFPNVIKPKRMNVEKQGERGRGEIREERER